jgi:hypothetical protein
VYCCAFRLISKSCERGDAIATLAHTTTPPGPPPPATCVASTLSGGALPKLRTEL